MTEIRTELARPNQEAELTNEAIKPSVAVLEDNAMLELDEVLVEYGDRTFYAEYEVQRFLATLTEAQQAEAEVLVDDESYVVFYPLLPSAAVAAGRSGFHFDMDSPRPTVKSVDVPELVGIFADQSGDGAARLNQRAIGIAVLLASVQL